jgi:N-acetylglucosamine kinase
VSITTKLKAGIDESTPLAALGMSLSGADDGESRKKIEAMCRSKYPSLSEHYYVSCDTSGPIATSCKNGGIVLIAGTGSNCEVSNPDGSTHRVGGWGHMIGDEGSAYWISHYCMKIVFYTLDNVMVNPHDITYVKNIMYTHFGVTDQMGMLEPLYTKFSKAHMAGFAKEIAKGALEEKDPICCEALHEAGRLLGRHILAIAPKVDKSLFEEEGGLRIVTVGSVFKSWDLMKNGFIEGMRPRNNNDIKIKEITLVSLSKPGTYGAAYLGAKVAGINIPVDYSANAQTIFHTIL